MLKTMRPMKLNRVRSPKVKTVGQSPDFVRKRGLFMLIGQKPKLMIKRETSKQRNLNSIICSPILLLSQMNVINRPHGFHKAIKN